MTGNYKLILRNRGDLTLLQEAVEKGRTTVYEAINHPKPGNETHIRIRKIAIEKFNAKKSPFKN